MFKKTVLFLCFLIVLVGMAAMNTGFFNKKVDLSYIKTAEAVKMVGNQDDEKIVKLQNQLAELQTKTGTEAKQVEIQNEINNIASRDIIISYDKTILDNFFNAIKKSKGYISNNIMKPKSGRIYFMTFGYSAVQNGSVDPNESLKLGYTPNIYVFPNDIALVPVYDAKSSNGYNIVEVRLSEEAITALDKFYNDQVNANK